MAIIKSVTSETISEMISGQEVFFSYSFSADESTPEIVDFSTNLEGESFSGTFHGSGIGTISMNGITSSSAFEILADIHTRALTILTTPIER